MSSPSLMGWAGAAATRESATTSAASNRFICSPMRLVASALAPDGCATHDSRRAVASGSARGRRALPVLWLCRGRDALAPAGQVKYAPLYAAAPAVRLVPPRRGSRCGTPGVGAGCLHLHGLDASFDAALALQAAGHAHKKTRNRRDAEARIRTVVCRSVCDRGTRPRRRRLLRPACRCRRRRSAPGSPRRGSITTRSGARRNRSSCSRWHRMLRISSASSSASSPSSRRYRQRSMN